jgi:hypothetical protein
MVRAHLTMALMGLTACLGACGGGSGTQVASTPVPVPTPTPTPTTTPIPTPTPTSSAVELVKFPPAGEFTRFAVGDDIRIRYDSSSGKYQVLVSGSDWSTLATSPDEGGYPKINNYFQPSSTTTGDLQASAHPNSPAEASRYEYSNLASWWVSTSDYRMTLQSGNVAFGTATPAGAVPVSGSATFGGLIAGKTNVTAPSGWGDIPNAPVAGNVSLTFDFGRGLLTGEIRPWVSCDCDPIGLPSALAFKNTVFGSGSTTFSGQFDTSVAGANTFNGLFTGPAAEELIGQWAFPFIFNGKPAAASGAWIAKRPK